MDQTIKIRLGNRRYPVTVKQEEDSRLFLSFNFNRDLINEIKSMEGARWHPEIKKWSIKASLRNQFRLQFLTEQNPYKAYDSPLIEWKSEWDDDRPYREDQKESVRQVLTRHYTLLAEEMGCGKSLEIIKAMEIAYDDYDCRSFIWCSSKGALYSTELELRKWKSKVNQSNGLQLLTYEGLVKMMKNWIPGAKAPQFVTFDECHKLKNPTSQRGQAGRFLGAAVRQEWEDKGFVVCMSGTPAPRDPCDIWNPAEVVCPGFIREGDIVKFKKRLAIIQSRESITGQVYPHLLGWRDSENKCEVCGKMKDDVCHSDDPEVQLFSSAGFHEFIACKNEVSLLYKRLKGLVLVKFKKDVINLPDLQYKIIRVKPTQSILNAAEIIKSKAESAIKTLILLRELSDGFQYKEEKVLGQYETCPTCNGSMVENDWIFIDPSHNSNSDHNDEELNNDEEFLNQEHKEQYPDFTLEEYARSKINNATLNYEMFPEWFIKEVIECRQCKGKGTVPLVRRETKILTSPKIDVIQNILEEHEEVQRCVIYAGFKGSIDNIIDNVKKWNWHWIRVDGRGWLSSINSRFKGLKPVELIEIFQNKEYDLGNSNGIVFVGNPDSAGEGITLTASPTIAYYSNSFDGKARTQSKARIHRPGMDLNLGATIIDIFHLPSDEYVYNNLEKKRKLEQMSLGAMLEELKKTEETYLREV